MNPEVLPPEWWKPHTRYFNSAADQTFATHLISKPITIQFFPGCAVTTIVLGSQLPGKDLVVGFDLYTKAKHLRILPNGLKYKQMFKPFVEISRLYLLETKQRINGAVEELKVKACAESHEEFLSKCDHPLWRNSEFFIQLPFKKNEDIIPTKASHSGMNPEHQKLAESECVDLLQQGLIEPSDSQWACEAFYVNKRSEQARGKLRLVINYQPLNQFLQDDKFPLPNRNALFSSLARAQIFSKFDLKAGFWQMGINPTDRPKTGFFIPNHHYQWKVMPFGLKTAPSLFQKAMIKIFQPVMENALIYIDDILLYSPDEESHLKLLEKFRQLVLQYGIMLSEKKMQICQQEIQFLGMNLKKGQYHP
ncbi:vesicle transport protein GOT1B-like [Hibiscus syriacus]|uniref:Vesicle transport protein GOT1B-like n=1 Tax=Hibiscus syriacus TaxID=106335 RepID=A0A6A2Y573_HIBSY|nr:vesicle transport protein GOT1B-like [Hibiscus syriacus]